QHPPQLLDRLALHPGAGEQVDGVHNGAERVAQLVGEHRQELVLAALGLLGLAQQPLGLGPGRLLALEEFLPLRLGAGGAAAGAAAGGALEESMARGLPHDELFVYEDALRRGRSVVIAVADDEEQANVARGVLTQAGAESVDAAREKWWLGLRDAEEAEYTVDGGDFGADEPAYRRGFEAALHPRARSRSYDEDAERLRECFGKECEESAFRRGYERGRRYQNEMLERYKS
ncbi:MAG TPA: hypothetical protein VE713_03515, partial [Pyrinomonadaceae bacterium]|nr:hypothetical protein [Pyrinomonadaceae bacterium]